MRILVITEFITPVNAVASVRWTKLSKYLTRSLGCEVDVLTNEKAYSGSSLTRENYLFDETISHDSEGLYRIVETPPGVGEKLANGIYQYLKRGRTAYRKRTPSSIDLSSGLYPSRGKGLDTAKIRASIHKCLRAVINQSRNRIGHRSDIQFENYDVLISSYGPAWVHYVARQVKRSNPGKLWIADYRDALAYSAETSTLKNLSFASRVTGTADCVTAVSSGVIENLNLPATQPYAIVPNGFDPDEFALIERRTNSKFTLVYTGTLYSENDAAQDLTPLFQVLEHLINLRLINANDVLVEYAGATQELYYAQAAKTPSVSAVSHGMLPRSEALELQRTASLLILATWNTENARGVVTGKLFEYLASGIPIVGLCSGNLPNSKVFEMLTSSRAGFCYEEARGQDSFLDLEGYVLACYEDWKLSGKTHCDSDWNYINSFSYKELAKKMLKVIESAKRGN